MAELVLYFFETCPYCKRVFNFLEKKDIKLTLKNIHKNKKAASELIEIGGKRQVPCLFIDGEPLYESDDIIKWLEKHY